MFGGGGGGRKFKKRNRKTEGDSRREAAGGFPSHVLTDGEAAGEGWEDAGGIPPRSAPSCIYPRALLITVK